MTAKAGDKVKIITAKDEFEGILMPDEKEFVVLKLSSGYNIGIDKKRVQETKFVSSHKEPKGDVHAAETKKELPTIAILHTGGTIASKVDYETGGVTAKFTPEEILGMFPELKDIANIRSRLVGNWSSEDLRFTQYNLLAHEVVKEIEQGVDGIIITHGTDTLHYTSAALSFMLNNLGVPVLLVGSQRSSDRGSTDSAVNLLSAAFFITHSKDFAEVAICMHEDSSDDWCSILPGTKTRKMHSARRNAFQAINVTPWARVNVNEKKVDLLRTGYRKRAKTKASVREFKSDIKVGILKTHTNMYASQFESYTGFDGLIIEGTGLGHAPILTNSGSSGENEKIAATLKKLIEKGTIVAMATQTIHGRINMDVYSPGRTLQELGIIGNSMDMTPETAFIKLAWLLSNSPKDKVVELYHTNLVGEISERLENIKTKKFT